MPNSKRKRKDLINPPSDEKVNKENNDQMTRVKRKAGKKEEPLFVEPGKAAVKTNSTQNIENDAVNISAAPAAQYHPEMDSFVSVRHQNEGIKVRLNLPKLVVPDTMLQIEERAIGDLRDLLQYIGFEVSDRSTLAFFVIGLKLNINSAARCFLNLYKLLNTDEFICPSRARMEQMEVDGLVEGFAYHGDGTFGPLINIKNYNVLNHNAAYTCREAMCYIFTMIDLSVLRRGLTMVASARDLTWRVFAPFEMAKTENTMAGCVPLPAKTIILIDPNHYAKLAYRVIKPIVKPPGSTDLLALDEFLEKYPLHVLPQSVSRTTSSNLIKHLSVEEQLEFNFFLD